MVGSSWMYHRQDMGTNAEWHRARDSNTTGWLGVGRKVMTWWNGDKMEGEETRVIQLLVRRTCEGCDNPRLLD